MVPFDIGIDPSNAKIDSILNCDDGACFRKSSRRDLKPKMVIFIKSGIFIFTSRAKCATP